MAQRQAEEKLLKAAHDFSGIYKFHCQCLFNIVFQNSLLYLPQKWNYRPMIWLNPKQVSPTDLLTPPKIIHYANPTKPWSEIGAEKSGNMPDYHHFMKILYTKTAVPNCRHLSRVKIFCVKF